MKYTATNAGYGYVVRLEKEEKLIASLKDLAKKEDITSGFFYGLGAVKNTTIGRYDIEKKKYEFKDVPDVTELASLNGNIALKEEELVVHAHAVLGNENLEAIAGHIDEAEVAITVEIFIHLQHGTQMERKFDEETRLDLLEFK